MEKEEKRIKLLADNMIVYVENPKESTENKLKKKLELSHLIQIITWKPIAFLHTYNKQWENKIKNSISFPILPKKIIV